MISAIILTKNNAETIKKTLESLSWCDEIVCIDDFSSDTTVEFAQKSKASVYQRHLDDDFAAQRNFGLEKAKGPARNALPEAAASLQVGSHSDAGGDWVLFIDSDEIISAALQREIRETISRQGTGGEGTLEMSNDKCPADAKALAGRQMTNGKQIQGYYIQRDDVFLGKKLKYGETKKVQLLRLARKNAGIWKRPVHEYWDVRGKTSNLKNPLLHISHTDVAQFIKEINWYTTINAEYLHKNNVRANAMTIIFYPIAKFLWNYIFLLGFLDKTPGAVMAIMMSFHSFLTRAKLYLLYHKKSS